jgi:hypothetical protein
MLADVGEQIQHIRGDCNNNNYNNNRNRSMKKLREGAKKKIKNGISSIAVVAIKRSINNNTKKSSIMAKTTSRSLDFGFYGEKRATKSGMNVLNEAIIIDFWC